MPKPTVKPTKIF